MSAAESHLEIGELVLGDTEHNHYASVAASLAVLAGIAAADALTCWRLGLVHRGQNHHDASALLEQAIPDGRQLAPVLRRLLSLKDASNYGTAPISRQKGQDAVRWARLLVERARLELES